MRDRHTIEAAVNEQPRRQFRGPGKLGEPRNVRREAEIALTGAPVSTPRTAGLPLIPAWTSR